MENNRGFKNTAGALAVLLLFQPAACFKRAMMVPPPPSVAKPPAVPVDEPPPSTVFNKKVPVQALGSEKPWTQTPPSLLVYWYPMPEEDPRLVEVNRYLAATCSPKPVKLTGFDHFLNSLWGVGQYVLPLAALLGALGVTQRK